MLNKISDFSINVYDANILYNHTMYNDHGFSICNTVPSFIILYGTPEWTFINIFTMIIRKFAVFVDK